LKLPTSETSTVEAAPCPISESPIDVPASIMPGYTMCPDALMPFAGQGMFAPTAVILPSAPMVTVPRSISAPLTVTILALQIA
jgi:hypothetical protein